MRMRVCSCGSSGLKSEQSHLSNSARRKLQLCEAGKELDAHLPAMPDQRVCLIEYQYMWYGCDLDN